MGCFSREYYIGHPVDDDDEFRNTMDEILSDDDPKRLHDYLNVFEDDYHYPAFLDMCLSWRAKECARHIIEGKLRHGPPLLLADHIEPKPDVPVLYQLTLFMCEPRVFDLVLDTCEAANQANYPYVGLLPLHWLLDRLTELPPFSNWSLGRSLSKLIASLFLPEIRPFLECARKLAQHTHSLDQVALGYILNGEIIPLAALLLVAPSFTKDETIMKTVFSKVCCGESIAATAGAAGLCEIFDKAGKALTEYWSTHKDEHEPVDVIVEVAEIIQSSGIKVLSTDVDLTDIDSTRFRPGMLKSICKRLGIEIGKTSGLSARSIEPPFPSAESVVQECRRAVPVYLDT